MTHFATADETEGENAGFMGEQLLRFRAAVAGLRPRFPAAAVHAANSAATFREPAAAFDMVRCGIALYGCSPFGGDPADLDLRPAMSLVSYLAATKTLRSRESVGLRPRLARRPGHAGGVVPVGYADGYAAGAVGTGRGAHGRAAGAGGGDDLDGPAHGGPRAGRPRSPWGRRWCCWAPRAASGSRAEELAALRGTINYEVVCAVGARVPRVHEG